MVLTRKSPPPAGAPRSFSARRSQAGLQAAQPASPPALPASQQPRGAEKASPQRRGAASARRAVQDAGGAETSLERRGAASARRAVQDAGAAEASPQRRGAASASLAGSGAGGAEASLERRGAASARPDGPGADAAEASLERRRAASADLSGPGADAAEASPERRSGAERRGTAGRRADSEAENLSDAELQEALQLPRPPPLLSAPAEGLLTAHHLSKRYKRRRVLDEMCIEVRRGQVVGLLGPNGAGKTTAFSIIAGVLAPDGGQVTLNGKSITRLPLHRRARLGLGYLPQERSVFRRLSVEENLMAVLERLGLPRSECKARLEAQLDAFQIRQVRHVLGRQLSGGEGRRVEIARMLALQPQFVLMDEPFAGVDPIAVLDLQEIIRMLRSQNIGVLITDHNVRETLIVTDYAYIIHQGKTLIEGKPQDLVHNALAKKVYLGHHFQI